MREIDEDADREIRRFNKLKDRRSGLDTFWTEIGDHVMPEESFVEQAYRTSTSQSASPHNRRWDTYDRLFDSTIARANWTLANGQFARVTPPNSAWFTFDAPFGLRENDRVVKWYGELTEIARELLQKSRFYSQIYRLYMQRGGFGTSLMYAASTDKTPLYFRSHPVGTYVLAEDDEGVTDTVYREFPLSARQAVQFFGEDGVGEDVSKAAKSENPGDQDKEFTFLHVVRPRLDSERDAGKKDPENMPIASIYIDVKAKKKCRVSGHMTMPYMASRYAEMGTGPYGWGPGFLALPEARQLNYLEMNLDVLAERAATPSVLAPADLEGELDLTAGGVTYLNPWAPHNNNLPREWAPAGSYQHGEARAAHKRQAIEDAFHVRLFMLFNMMDDKTERTAREIQEKANERLTQFYPTFSLLTTELLNPILSQVFQVALEARGFGSIPPELIQQADGRAFIPDPTTSFSSTIGLAMKRVDNSSFLAWQQIVGPMLELAPQMADHLDWNRISRDIFRNEGGPTPWLLDIDKVQANQQARAQQQAQEQALLAGATVSDAVSKTKGMPTSEIEEKLSLVS